MCWKGAKGKKGGSRGRGGGGRWLGTPGGSSCRQRCTTGTRATCHRQTQPPVPALRLQRTSRSRLIDYPVQRICPVHAHMLKLYRSRTCRRAVSGNRLANRSVVAARMAAAGGVVGLTMVAITYRNRRSHIGTCTPEVDLLQCSKVAQLSPMMRIVSMSHQQ